MSSWGEIPRDVAMEIAMHIEYYEDFERFGQVCSWWRHASKNVSRIAPSCHAPCLMLAKPPRTSKRQLYNLYSGKIHHVELPTPQEYDDDVNGGLVRMFQEDEDLGDWRYFSSRGWLISVTQYGYNITLVNPFSREVIKPPCIPEDFMLQKYTNLWQDDLYLHIFSKFALCQSPSKATASKDFTLAMIFSMNHSVGFWSYGNDDWILLDWQHLFCIDITFYKGEFYAVDQFGKIVAFGEGVQKARPSPTPRVVTNQLQWQNIFPDNAAYLVESDGALLVVRREIEFDDASYKTLYFKVWEVNVDTGDVKEVKSLGNNRALFVGLNSSFSLETSPSRGCKPNCIYYTDDCLDLYLGRDIAGGGIDMGVYDVVSGRMIEDYYDGPSRFSHITPPLWVEPS